MSTHRRRAAATGILFILAAVTSIIGLLQYAPILDHTGYVVEGSAQVGRVASGALLELTCVFSIIGTAILMFPLLRKRSETAALGYVCFRLLEAAIIVVGIISLLSVMTLGQEFSRAQSPDAAAYLTASRLLVAQHDWSFLFGPNLALGPSTLMMGWFLYRSRLVPRWIAALGIVGGPLILASGVLVLFGVYEQISVWGTVCALPVFLYEMTLAVWLVARGFRPAGPASLPAR
ncbi:DUF4386 domain-containing protein [Streptomyces sp. H39-S7]|uniref:DUF4386 domain-containing protein n=1 Tax=Streptomyces sp. H39-S7 TaxID=3004357 RepID=UPI0022AFA637|nr:DUF4386 domain-containing protein [Streptomyces sp. H39-S7]MCZ4124394.1 DUF4386 domain-containing protein [Streptomyces sp. H39-S7]